MAEPQYVGRRVGAAVTLRRLRDQIEKQFGPKGWKEYFREEIFPLYGKILYNHAINHAEKTARSKTLRDSIRKDTDGGASRGGAGSGTWAFALRLDPPGSEFGGAMNEGKTLRPKKAAHLTIPIGQNKDEHGNKIIGMRSIKRKQGFTIDQKNGSLAGKKVVYMKGEAARAAGFSVTPKEGQDIKRAIIPVFLLVKHAIVPPTHWADKAVDDAIKEFFEKASVKVQEHLSKKLP